MTERETIDTDCAVGAALNRVPVVVRARDRERSAGECVPGLAVCLADLDRTELLLVDVRAGDVRPSDDDGRGRPVRGRTAGTLARQALEDEPGRVGVLGDRVGARLPAGVDLRVRPGVVSRGTTWLQPP